MLIRFVEITDLEKGFLEVLNELADTSQLTLEQGRRAILSIKNRSNKYIIVAVDDDMVVGTGSIYIEEKIIHNNGWVAHIEDVVVSSKHRNKGVGKEIVDWLNEFARVMGAYKVLLECSFENIGFYEKCGFYPRSISMRKDIENADISVSV